MCSERPPPRRPPGHGHCLNLWIDPRFPDTSVGEPTERPREAIAGARISTDTLANRVAEAVARAELGVDQCWLGRTWREVASARRSGS